MGGYFMRMEGGGDVCGMGSEWAFGDTLQSMGPYYSRRVTNLSSLVFKNRGFHLLRNIVS